MTLTDAHPDSLEVSLFLRMATTRPTDANRIASAGDLRALDWDRLIGFALLENAATLLDDRISRIPESLLPGQYRDRIGRLGLVWTFKLKLLERRLQQSLDALANAGIEVILLKGAALAAITHRSFTDRPMADVDMLVDPLRARDAHDLMQRQGWMLDSSGHPDDAWNNHHHLPPLADKNGSGLRLEIHVAPISPGHPFNIDFARLRATAERRTHLGVEVLVPEIHVYAVHSAIHFAWSHRFESGALNAFRDLGVLESTGSFSWVRLVEVARQTSAETCCYWTLRLAQSLAGLVVPERVLKDLAPPIREPFLSLLDEHFSQLVLRSERACPSVALRYRLWAFALQTKSAVNEESMQWEVDVRAAVPRRMRVVRRVGSHLQRARQWSLYLASMFAALAAEM
ncbi:MAG: hypothetical protein DMD72_11140 [Gemmatimonadetes bacterium]|nr:MAG: hypothetical protein DMD72_11140 [Gemmatimonadota bacterium]